MKSQGFTLIELLVVIAIIAILAALLFPVFANAREEERRAVCIHNEKQLGIAFEQYLDDYDGDYPFIHAAPEIHTWTPYYLGSWKYLLRNYVKNKAVYACPSNDYAYDWDHNNNQGPQPPYPPNEKDRYPVSYGMNGFIYTSRYRTDKIPDEEVPFNRADIPSPNETLLLGEIRMNLKGWDDVISPDIFHYRGDSIRNAVLGAVMHHHKITNYLFADGHIKGYRADRMVSPPYLWGPFLDAFGYVSIRRNISMEYR